MLIGGIDFGFVMRRNMSIRGKRKFVVTTDGRHDLPVAENLLARDFSPTAPDQVWSMQAHMQTGLVVV